MKKLVSLLCVIATFSLAQTPPVPAEASQAFERGVRFFKQKNHREAALEFQKVYRLVPKTVVLYNLALVYAAGNEPLQCLDSIDKILVNPGELNIERVKEVTLLRNEQLKLLGEVSVEALDTGVEVEVLGRTVGQTPISKPIYAAPGRVVVSGKAPKKKPTYFEAEVRKGERLQIKLELAPLEQNLGTVVLKSQIPGASVYVDGMLVGFTSQISKFPVVPGERTIEVRRSGYITAQQKLLVGEGTELEVELNPVIDGNALSNATSSVAIHTSKTEVVVKSDGTLLGVYSKPISLLPGKHVLQFDRGGYFGIRRDIDLNADERRDIELKFEPTPELLADIENQQTWHTRLGIIGLSAGAAAVVGSSILLVTDLDSRKFWEDKKNFYESDAQQRIGCPNATNTDCGALITQAQEKIALTRSFDTLGYIGLGAGILFVGAGMVSIFTSPSNPGETPEGESGLAPLLGFNVMPGGGMASVSGKF